MPGQAMGPPHWLRRFMQLSKIRDAANGKTERAAGARVWRKSIWEPAGVSRLAAHSDEARVPKPIIQEGKKGFRSLMSVFMEIRAVTGFSGEMLTTRNRRVSGIIAGRK